MRNTDLVILVIFPRIGQKPFNTDLVILVIFPRIGQKPLTNSLFWGPYSVTQLLHKLVHQNHSVELTEWFNLEVGVKGNLDLKHKKKGK